MSLKHQRRTVDFAIGPVAVYPVQATARFGTGLQRHGKPQLELVKSDIAREIGDDVARILTDRGPNKRA